MVSIDITTLLRPVSEDAPCGEDLEYDAAFGELERAAQGTPQQEMGDEVIPAKEPNWPDVFERAEALLARTKDLRVAVHLLHSAMRISGLPAFSAGMSLIHGLLTDYWDTIHPQLDKEDNDDPTLRMNSLLLLNDRAGIVAVLSRCPLVHSRTLGSVTLRNIRVAAGDIAPTEQDGPAQLDAAQIDAAFLDGDLDGLQANADAARSALDTLTALGDFINGQVGASRAPDLGGVTAELKAVQRVLAEQLARRGVAEPGAVGGEDGTAGAESVAASGEIRSREDVVRVLDRMCDYFHKNEPSSPVPLLLQRARRLVAKDFMGILRDLTPDAVSQAKLIGGLDKDD